MLGCWMSLKDHVSHGQGYLLLDLVAQGPIQSGLEHCQGWQIAK